MAVCRELKGLSVCWKVKRIGKGGSLVGLYRIVQQGDCRQSQSYGLFQGESFYGSLSWGRMRDANHVYVDVSPSAGPPELKS